ncbi:tryptophan synthase subunit alpha [Segetibacter sp. 3557_3]|uniref:tryptophan synthase subunit alpha n=1 Tax=Segetibacter sp. 3557_3 TaxID=2547429 RepID=UPI0010589FEE|nr:tryptophan synthase subunit alpha [Segetibacter sp. 3557_3]TDH27850.1 tryptophan synthase subunit alpha [Segetibacter sp. 3557_3]
MKRLSQLFATKKQRILNVYCTAGYPELDSTLPVMKALEDQGADIIELGMPYSDPLADGPVIQESSLRAIENGMTIATLFNQLSTMRTGDAAGTGKITIPVILMGYMNPVLQYGFERFCEKAAEVGIDGLILPDLPMHEYETIYGPTIRKFGLDLVFLVTPETGEQRIRRIDALSSGFLYAVSSSSTTGSNKNIGDQEAYFQKLQSMQLQNPVLVGFGIKDKSTFDAACKYTNGAIIGSAYIKALEHSTDVAGTTKSFLSNIIAQ